MPDSGLMIKENRIQFLLLLHLQQNILLFFLKKNKRIMQKQINEISLKIALNLLNDYIKQKSLQLTHIHQRFAREFINKQEVDLHQWLLNETKSISQTVKNLIEGIKDYFADLKIEFVYSFFQKCFQAVQQSRKYLTQIIMQKINKKIDIVRPHIFVAPVPPVILGTDEQQMEQPKEQGLKRYSKEINRDLQSLDYFLNLLAYEDNKTYEEYKSQCDKILLQRQLLQNIKPSQASKQIMETANMIDNVMENSDKVFQDSYLLKYMEFKSFMNDLKKPEELNDLYRQEMENATRQKFKDGMNRTLKKCYAINKRENLKNKISFGIQTDQIKGAKYQQKLQNLLIIEKKNNQKLTTQIKLLRKNRPNSQDQLQIQKIIEREQIKQKQANNKYKILENMYNQKCEQLQKHPYQQIFIQKQQEKKQLISIAIQAQPQQSKSLSTQTDLDFYYYFESNKIYDYKVKIIQLEQELKHKEYTIRQMGALRTFRDNFKSKKQVYQTAIKSSRKIERAKTLHYLDEDDQIYDIRNEGKKAQLSFQGSNTKKKVTLQDLDQNGQARNKEMAQSKKMKKKTEVFKNKAYFALNSNIQDEVQQQQKSELEIQKISIKSILKLGSNQFKKDFGMQTEGDKIGLTLDYVIQQGIGKSKIQKVKLSSRDKSERSAKILRTKAARQSQTSSHFKDLKQKKNILEEAGSLRKSNFMALGQLNDHKQQKQSNMTMNMTVTTPFRMSGMSGVLASPKKMLQMKTEKPSYFTRASKWNQSKVSTVANQVLHVNNSLNCHFLAPITSSLKQSISGANLIKNKSKYQNMKKTNKII